MRKYCAAAAAIILTLSAAQAAEDEPREKAGLPETDIFLFDFNLDTDSPLSNGQNITPRAGYDNQPSFTPGSKTILFSRGDDYQTDVYEYEIDGKVTRQITNTLTNEFSPISGPDNDVISFVTGGAKSIQNIAKIARANPADMTFILPGQALREPVGYYGWDHSSGNVLFWSRYGFNVTLASVDGAETAYITGDAVPSTPHLIPGTSKFSFVHGQGNGETWIKELNPETKAVRPLTPLAGVNANYGWTPDGSILIIQNDKLYSWSENSTTGWAEIADLSEHAVTGAARLSVSPDGRKIAIVGLPAKP